MLHHHCVTADPQRTRNVFARIVGGGSQRRATLDVSHCHFRVGHKSAGLILNCTYDTAGIFLCEAKNGQCKGDDKHKQHAGIHRARHAILPWVRRRREHVLRITAEVNSLMLFYQRIDELRYSYERLLLLSNGSVCQDENSWGLHFGPSLGRTANIVSKSHWPPCDAFHGVSEAFRSLRIPDKLKLK